MAGNAKAPRKPRSDKGLPKLNTQEVATVALLAVEAAGEAMKSNQGTRETYVANN